MAQNARPPIPGPFVQPNYLAVMEQVSVQAETPTRSKDVLRKLLRDF